jgi:hypothetical protein
MFDEYTKATVLMQIHAKKWGVSVKKLQTPGRSKTLTNAKHEMWRILKKETSLSVREINDLLGMSPKFHLAAEVKGEPEAVSD